jgi:hypothetical protein
MTLSVGTAPSTATDLYQQHQASRPLRIPDGRPRPCLGLRESFATSLIKLLVIVGEYKVNKLTFNGLSGEYKANYNIDSTAPIVLIDLSATQAKHKNSVFSGVYGLA